MRYRAEFRLIFGTHQIVSRVPSPRAATEHRNGAASARACQPDVIAGMEFDGVDSLSPSCELQGLIVGLQDADKISHAGSIPVFGHSRNLSIGRGLASLPEPHEEIGDVSHGVLAAPDVSVSIS
jgi:hypothetical protein